MYTILVRNDDSLTATQRENIYHRTSGMQKFRILVDKLWTKNGMSFDMTAFDCTLEYRTPISHKWTPVHLTASDALYKDKVEYLLDITLGMTAEVGMLELKLTWAKLDMNADGSFNPRVRKTPEIGVEILPTAQWSDYVAESDFDMMVQYTLQNQAYMNQVGQYAEEIKQLTQYNTISKADNMRTEETEDGKQIIQLESMGMPIGEPVEVKGGNGNCDCEEGIPAVDFSGVEPDKDIEVDNVVEF